MGAYQANPEGKASLKILASVFLLEVDANLTSFPFKPKAPWTKHYSGIEKKNELETLLWIPQVTRANTNPPHTPRNTRE